MLNDVSFVVDALYLVGLILAYGIIVLIGGTNDLAGAAFEVDTTDDVGGSDGVFPPIVWLLAQLTVTTFGLVSVFLGFQVCACALSYGVGSKGRGTGCDEHVRTAVSFVAGEKTSSAYSVQAFSRRAGEKIIKKIRRRRSAARPATSRGFLHESDCCRGWPCISFCFVLGWKITWCVCHG